MLNFNSRVNERVLEAFCSRYHVRYRPNDVELKASALIWSLETKVGRAAFATAEAAEEFRSSGGYVNDKEEGN
jgi:hypothetical protein